MPNQDITTVVEVDGSGTTTRVDSTDVVETTETPKEEEVKIVQKQAKILIAVPCQEMVNVQFISSLMALQRPTGSTITFTQSSILPQSRDVLANTAINNGFTHILFIDSDMTFPPDALHKLFVRDVDICTALCFARKGDHNPCIYKRINYENPVKGQTNGNITVEDDIDREFFEIKACGMAFCLIKTSVLKDIRDKNDGDLFRYIATFGEDLSFCVRALKAGYKLYCDTTIPIGHVGEYVFTKKDWILSQKIKEAKEEAIKKQQEEKEEAEKKNAELDAKNAEAEAKF